MMSEEFVSPFKNRKICIGYSSPDLISVEFVTSLIQMITETAQYVPMGLTNCVSSRIAVNRNAIVENARSVGATDILWIDADTKFPIASLLHLLTHDKDIACATTCTRKGNSRAPIGIPEDMESVSPYQKMVKMGQIGMPFMLTRMSVFDKIDEMGLAPDRCYFAEPPRWMFRKSGWEVSGQDPLVAEDEYFCYLVKKAGFDIWCDMELSMQIGHVGMTTFYVEQNQSVALSSRVDIKLGQSEESAHRENDGFGE